MNGAAGHQHLRRQAQRVRRRRPGRCRGERGRALPQLVGDQHGLVVLLLVLGDHAVGEPVGEQRGPGELGRFQQVHDPAADFPGVRAGLGGRQQRQRGPRGPRVLERVVERVDLGVHRLPAAHVAQQPQLFLVGDVREVPDQRRHQRRVLADQVGVVDGLGEQPGPFPGREQVPGDQVPQLVRSGVSPQAARLRAVALAARGGGGRRGRHEDSSRHASGLRGPGGKLSATRASSSRSSAGQRPRST